jgi:hypothetical protein
MAIEASWNRAINDLVGCDPLPHPALYNDDIGSRETLKKLQRLIEPRGMPFAADNEDKGILGWTMTHGGAR